MYTDSPPDAFVLLDCGGVLYNDLRHSLVQELSIRFDLPPAQITHAYEWLGLRQHLWEGRITTGEFWTTLGQRLGVPLDPATWDRWCVEVQIPKLDRAWLTQLRGMVQLGLLTNHRHEWLMPALERDRYVGLLESVIVSSQVGLSKPTPAIYSAANICMGHSEHRLFVDDQDSNLIPAKEQGFDVLLADDEGLWVQQLQDWVAQR